MGLISPISPIRIVAKVPAVDHLEYLLSYGLVGDFGRFRAARPLSCRRGDRAVIRTHRGLEIGEVLREAAPGHAGFLPNTTVGRLLRLAGPDDDQTSALMRNRARSLFDRGRALAVEQKLPLDLIDAEVLHDGEHGVLHLLRRGNSDVRPFVSTLSREFGLHILLTDLGAPGASLTKEEEPAGCGREGCGQEGGGGGCTSCGPGGCGSCDTKETLASSHDPVEQGRTALL
jgi:cell fate regulator YaaT (PSP1 superfamily)